MPALINGAMLKDVRAARGLSQEELGHLSGVSKPTIARIEGSKQGRRCNLTTASRLARALGVEVEDLQEDQFQRIVDIGEGLEIRPGKLLDVEEFRNFSEKIIRLIEVRNRILSGSSADK